MTMDNQSSKLDLHTIIQQLSANLLNLVFNIAHIHLDKHNINTRWE